MLSDGTMIIIIFAAIILIPTIVVFIVLGICKNGRKRKKNAKNRGKRVRSSSVRVSVRAFLYLARSCTTNTHHGNTPAVVPKTLLRHDRKKRVSPNSGCNRDTSA